MNDGASFETNDDGELSFDYSLNKKEFENATTSRNSMEVSFSIYNSLTTLVQMTTDIESRNSIVRGLLSQLNLCFPMLYIVVHKKLGIKAYWNVNYLGLLDCEIKSVENDIILFNVSHFKEQNYSNFFT